MTSGFEGDLEGVGSLDDLERLDTCPDCGEDLFVDLQLSELLRRPQVIAVRCRSEGCGFQALEEAPVDGDGDGIFYTVGTLRCRVCGAEAPVVVPLSADDTHLECFSCRHLSAELVDDEDDDDDEDGLVPA